MRRQEATHRRLPQAGALTGVEAKEAMADTPIGRAIAAKQPVDQAAQSGAEATQPTVRSLAFILVWKTNCVYVCSR